MSVANIPGADTRSGWVGRRRISKQNRCTISKKNCIASINLRHVNAAARLVARVLDRVWLPLLTFDWALYSNSGSSLVLLE